MILPPEFYVQEHVTDIAHDLIGKVLFSNVDNALTAGIIVETEAYCGETDKASHAYPNKETARTKTMFGDPGIAYVYLCYGIYNLFNVVVNEVGKADAVLVRAIEPLLGMETMKSRRKITANSINLTSGPGKLSMALNITRRHNGMNLTTKEGGIWIEDHKKYRNKKIITSKRIGVDYAGIDAELPWRYYIDQNLWVSRGNLNRRLYEQYTMPD